MKALILAGGFAKRLWPLTIDRPKPLLPVAGKPMIEYLIDKLDELEVEDIIISTNMKFKPNFDRWLSKSGRKDITIIVEEARSEKEKAGAIKALANLTEGMKGDCFVAAGDNLFTGSLKDMIEIYRQLKDPIVGLYDIRDVELVNKYSTVIVNSDNRILEFIEKPKNPKTTLIGTCLYIFPNRILARLKEYVEGGLSSDAPGGFIEWLCKKELVYGYLLEGVWWDIGTIQSYNNAKRYFSKISI